MKSSGFATSPYFNYDNWLTSYPYKESCDDDDEEVEEYDYCDAHEEELKLAGEW